MTKEKVNKFPRTFWVANTMELIERWAWYGFYMIFAISILSLLAFFAKQKAMREMQS